MIRISPGHTVQPLDSIRISGADKGRLLLRDGRGALYADVPATDPTELLIGGALGAQVVQHVDAEGRVLASASVQVATRTGIEDAKGRFRTLLELLHDTLFNDWHSGYRKGLRIDGKWYRFYVSWIRDHVHALKGMKYWDCDADGIKSGIELYADSQRADGMIYDKCKDMLHSELQNWRDVEFAEGDFIKPIPGHPDRRWQRVPVENDVEYLWIEGLYYTWKATGDSAWMHRYLDQALAAVRYSTSDPYRWSDKYQLLKRGYTIDSWDFQHAEDVARSGSHMRVHPEKTVFGVFFGDNTGMVASCRYLAIMLRDAQRDAEADEMAGLADRLQERLDALAWNGRFYTHHVSEQPSVTRDCGGTDESTQVVQSNAYSLNRGIDHDKALAIIDSYQRIREEMPATSAGEWYACYPPFEKGFGHAQWNYMNGGVTSICAGELAHGAFEHGREDYAVDILQRQLDWTERLGGYLHCTLKGKLPEQPAARYSPVDITALANVAWRDDEQAGVVGWTGEGANDMRGLPTGRQTFEGVDVQVLDDEATGGRSCIGLAQRPGYLQEVSIPVGAAARSVYLLHAVSGSGSPVGWMTVRYADGTHATQYITMNQQVGSFFMPAPNHAHLGGNKGNKRSPHLRVAWQGPNGVYENVGMFIYGWPNPHPERRIEAIELTCAEQPVQWFIGGVSLSDQPV
ncbi:MAG: hypothetical protein ACOCXJ_03960, partial [Planctomycetota bacterium]